MKQLPSLAGAALALTSAWALAQDAPELLLPPGFDRPAPKAAPRARPTAADPAPAAQTGDRAAAPAAGSAPSPAGSRGRRAGIGVSGRRIRAGSAISHGAGCRRSTSSRR